MLGASIAVFDMMSDPAGVCTGTPNSLGWEVNELFGTRFAFNDGGNPVLGHNMNLALVLAGPSGPTRSYGSGSVTRNDAPPTPEPSSFILALAVGALLVLNRRRPATRKSGPMTH
jgi:hypothetical protein